MGNLRPTTVGFYSQLVHAHVLPRLGTVRLRSLDPPTLNRMAARATAGQGHLHHRRGRLARIGYTADGITEVAEADYGGRRLTVRRTRLAGAARQALFPGWRDHGFVTDLDGPAVEVDRLDTPTLRAPLHWPWAYQFNRALANIRALPAAASG